MDEKFLQAILSGQQDHNISFSELRLLLASLGFKERIKGDHFIYNIKDLPEIINIQPDRDKAKSYQVRQIRTLIKKYDLGGAEK